MRKRSWYTSEMNLKYISPLRQGFTIVELLIVVVVIAILASITVVAYNGVTAKAENTRTISLLNEWTQKLEMYKVKKDQYPQGSLEYVCLGDGYIANSDFTAGQCMKAQGWSVSTDAAWIQDVKSTVDAIPDGSYTKVITLPDGSNRGMLYLSRNGGNGITYILHKTDAGCSLGDAYYEQGEYLVCRRVLQGSPYDGL